MSGAPQVAPPAGGPLYLLRYFPTLTETFVNNELEAMVEAGVRPTVLRLGGRADGALRPGPPPTPWWEAPRGPRTWPLALRAPTAGQRFVAAHQRPKDALRYRAALERIRRGPRPSLVHVHFAGEAAEWAEALRLDLDLPWTLMVHAVDLHKPRPSLPTLLRGAARTLCVADADLAGVRAAGARAARLRCGPDLDRWAQVDRGPVAAGPLRALFVARDVPKNGLDQLLAAWPAARAAAPGATLTLLTDRRAPAAPPDGTDWRGLRAPAEVAEALAQANVLVLPSARAPDGDQDGVPLVLMEALAAGRPVITTPTGGITELVDAEVGWLCPPGAVDALSAALIAAGDPAARAARGAGGPARLRARGFTLADQVAGLRATWAGLAPDQGRGQPTR